MIKLCLCMYLCAKIDKYVILSYKYVNFKRFTIVWWYFKVAIIFVVLAWSYIYIQRQISIFLHKFEIRYNNNKNIVAPNITSKFLNSYRNKISRKNHFFYFVEGLHSSTKTNFFSSTRKTSHFLYIFLHWIRFRFPNCSITS